MTRMGTTSWSFDMDFPSLKCETSERLRIYYRRMNQSVRWTLYFMNYIYIVYTMIRIGKIVFFRRLQHCFSSFSSPRTSGGVCYTAILSSSIDSIQQSRWMERWLSLHQLEQYLLPASFWSHKPNRWQHITCHHANIRWGIYIPSHQHEGRTEHLEYW